MALVSKTVQEKLQTLKKNVEYFCEYFKPNCDRFNEFRKFTFDTSITTMDMQYLAELGKPQIEFNYGEAYLSRLIGEFAKQEPSISVSAADGVKVTQDMVPVIEFVEGYMRHILFEANNNSFESTVYKDVLSGGFSGMKVWTDYCNEMSFHQDINVGKVFSATLMGFDPLAQLPHKGDGEYCFELYPKRLDEFERDFPNVDLTKLSFTANANGYKWSYRNNRDKIVLICDYYEKKKKRTKIVRLANNKVLTEKDYKYYLETFVASGEIAQPAIVIDTRWTDIQTICRYRFIESQVIEYIETDYDELPIIFVDGNSVLMEENGTYYQMTRPYLYNAKGIQKMINYSGQSLAFELINMVQHKWKIAAESINDAYIEAYQDNQVPNIIIYNAFNKNNPGQQVPPPQEVMRQPCPPEIMQTFSGGAQIFQNIMGSYDASVGNISNQISGKAVIESATQGNAVAMPHIMGYLQALNQLAQIIVKLIPKYLVTPRSVPVRKADGKKSYQLINQPGGIDINYCPNELQVKVEAGVNFTVQKNRTLLQIQQMMGTSQIFDQFMNAKGLKVLVNNMDIRGQDELSTMAEEFMQEMKQNQAQQQKAQQQAQQMAQQEHVAKMQQMAQGNPMVQLKQQEIQQKGQHGMADIKLKAQQIQDEKAFRTAEIMNDAKKTDNETLAIHLKAAESIDKTNMQAKKNHGELFARGVELSLESAALKHQHAHDDARLVHDVLNSAHENDRADKATNETKETKD